MHQVIFDYSKRHDPKFLPFYVQFLRLRKRVFVDQAGWSLPTHGDLELDQYDNPNTTYLLIIHNGQTVAGARVIPSDQEWHGWTNLVRDAVAGRIDGVDRDILPKDYDFSGSFECSRLVMDHDLLSRQDAAAAFRLLGVAFDTVAKSRHFKVYLSISPPALLRKYRALGFNARAVGRKFTCPDDGKKYAVLRLDNSA